MCQCLMNIYSKRKQRQQKQMYAYIYIYVYTGNVDWKVMLGGDSRWCIIRRLELMQYSCAQSPSNSVPRVFWQRLRKNKCMKTNIVDFNLGVVGFRCLKGFRACVCFVFPLLQLAANLCKSLCPPSERQSQTQQPAAKHHCCPSEGCRRNATTGGQADNHTHRAENSQALPTLHK